MGKAANFHEQFRSEAPVKLSSSNRTFGAIFAIIFALVGLYPLLHGGPLRLWAMIVAMLFLGVTLVLPRAFTPLVWLWMRFGYVLHKISNPVILALMYYVAVVPTGLIMRSLGKRPLHLSFDKKTSSYWITRDSPEPDTMKNQF